MPGRYLSSKLLDDFGSGLGNWSTWRTGVPLVITSGTLTNDGVNFRCGSYYSVAQFGPAVEATYTIPAFGSTANDSIEVNVRVSTTDSSTASFYNFVIANSAGGGIALNYFNGGAFSANLAADAAFNTWTAGDKCTVEANGSSLTMYRNGASVLTGTDSNITAAGWIAIEITNTAKTDTVDNLFGGTIVLAEPRVTLQAGNRAASF